jgi:hypothetical protein
MRKLLLLLPLVLIGCCTTPEATAVERERGITKVVKDRFLTYSAADPNLTDAQKRADVNYWGAWESWLTDREDALAK